MNDQRSVTEQLKDLYWIAVEHGLYDAADFIKQRLDHRGFFIDYDHRPPPGAERQRP